MPRLRLWIGSSLMRWPLMRISPALGLSSPAIMRSVVVLPQPEGPSSVTNAPVGTTRSMLSTATMLWPKRLVTW